jgi:hypothetical protein
MKTAMTTLAAVLLGFAVLAPPAAARPVPQTMPGDSLDPRTYDPGARLFLVAHATGVQKYTCQANGTWLFTDPEATLFKTTGTPKAIGAHFLNFATGRPVWMLHDGSMVEAARKASAPAGSGKIPLLLLQAAATAGDRLGETTWVQRLNTAGGVAPAGTCTPGDHADVSYAADYFFWKTPD